MRMLPKEEEEDIPVTAADQALITEFSVLSQLHDERERKIEGLGEKIEALGEARDEIELGDEYERVLYKIQSCFMHLLQETALRMISEEEKRAEEEIQTAKDAQEKSEARMKVLKTELYAKFGRSINLER